MSKIKIEKWEIGLTLLTSILKLIKFANKCIYILVEVRV